MYGQYILKDGKVVEEENPLLWAKWMATENRVVKKTHVGRLSEVSTIFLGLDHGFGRTKNPVLFETMIFGGERDGYCKRYYTWDEAIEGHDKIVEEFFMRCPYCNTLRENDETKCKSCGGNF